MSAVRNRRARRPESPQPLTAGGRSRHRRTRKAEELPPVPPASHRGRSRDRSAAPGDLHLRPDRLAHGLTGLPAPALGVILDEAAPRRPIGSSAVMRRQLERLLETAGERHITVQVLPFDQGGHEAMGGSLTILVLPDGSEVACTEGSDYGQLIEEPDNVSRCKVIHDRLRAVALPPAHVPRHDSDRDGGQLPWRERPVPIRTASPGAGAATAIKRGATAWRWPTGSPATSPSVAARSRTVPPRRSGRTPGRLSQGRRRPAGTWSEPGGRRSRGGVPGAQTISQSSSVSSTTTRRQPSTTSPVSRAVAVASRRAGSEAHRGCGLNQHPVS